RMAELLTPGTVDASTRLVLVNALYLLAAWESPFLPENTSLGTFTLTSGETTSVPLMRQTAVIPYTCTDTAQVVDLAYEGGDLALLIALPREGITLSEVESVLTPEVIAAWVEALESTHVTIHLPPFRLRTAMSLRDPLQAMGMPLAFSDQADFSGLAGRTDLTIDDVIHEAFIDVDEAGTEAAAATAVVIRVTSLPLEPVSFRADRPFLFLLRERHTGTILFMGRVEDPS
ncbi:MAG TPA: serpin family protein, partial [Candidatus Acetothermia bacterium]|nr:serpin family protein [Candidatus Acetothermia bacterium]